MNFENNRLNTFSNWPSSAPVDPARIAKAGFYYTGEGTEVQCFSCNAKISQWNYGDQVMWRHRRLKPNCEFVVNPTRSGNVPILAGPECTSSDVTNWSVLEEGQNVVESATHDYGLTEEDEMYRSDGLRLLSFINWDGPAITRKALVDAGFYNAGEGRVRCAWCGGELSPFSNFDNIGSPLDIHRMYFPRCDHAATLAAAQRSNNLSPPSSPSSDTAPITSPDSNSSEAQSSGAAHNARVLVAGGTWRALGVVGGGARHPTLAPLAVRLASYGRWPATRPQSPRALAEAGFFHTGTDDQVRCFYCDGGLGKWEAGDAPWSEHARWFPHCGFVLLVKGQEFVDRCRGNTPNRTISAESETTVNRRNPGITFPITESQIDECMESVVALGALSAGLDAARVRRALVRRLRATGASFSTAEALIDAVLDDQLNEEAWSETPQSQRFARDILAETLREFVPRTGYTPTIRTEDRPDSQTSQSDHQTRSPTPEPLPTFETTPSQHNGQNADQIQVSNTNHVNERNSSNEHEETNTIDRTRKESLEEENRKLKEARLCKVCMDNEVSVVFLPCGHLVSCARCGAALPACPLCRASVKALVRAYLA